MVKNTLLSYLKYIGSEAGKEREKAVKSLLPHGANLLYLDCGCEDGRLTLERANMVGTKKIYGIEVLDSEIEKASARGIAVEKCDLNKKIPFKKDMFDVITATQVIEHLYELDMFVSELHRLLKQGGILIISTENLSAWHNIFALILGHQPSTGPFISSKFPIGFHPLSKEHAKDHKLYPHLKAMAGHTRVMAYNSFKKLFLNYGFELICEKEVGYYPFPSVVANFFSWLDKWHSLDIIFKLKKR